MAAVPGGIDKDTILMISSQHGVPGQRSWRDTSIIGALPSVHDGSNGDDDATMVIAGTSKKDIGGRGMQIGGFTVGSSLTLPQHDDYALGTGPFTIELWNAVINQQGGNQPQYFIDMDGPATGVTFFRDGNSNELRATVLGTTYVATGVTLTGLTFFHLALVRESDTVLKMYVNGTKVGSTFNPTGKSIANSNGITLMNGFTNSNQNESIQSEIRISKVARWTANFTPPTAPYRSSGVFNHMLGASG